MMQMHAHEKILRAFAASGLLSDARVLAPEELEPFFRERAVVAALEGKCTVKGVQVTLRVGLTRRFPLALPKIYLHPWDALGYIPHVSEDGYVCYAQTEGLLLNSEDPVGIVVEATQQALCVLEKGISSRNRLDFMDEFVAYWLRVVPNMTWLRAFFEANDTIRKVYAYRNREGYKWVADGDSSVLAYYNGHRKVIGSLTQRTALYIPLHDGACILPPPPRKPWSTQDVRRIVHQHLSATNLRRLEQLGRKWKPEELVILGLPRPSGGKTLVGLLFRDVQGGHPLLSGTAQDPPEPLGIERYDAHYLLSRGGAQIELTRTRVLLVGCGAVGGYIALSLPSTGLLDLTLIDPDVMARENTFRHALGHCAEGVLKVDALKKELELKYPYVSVKAHSAHIEDAVADGSLRLADFDIVIFALGNPTVELHMNRLLHEGPLGPKAVFTWLEPYGIGGHALLTRPGVPGCLQCLYTPVNDSTGPLENRAAFAAADQFFGKNDLGCGSLYTPYGALDAQRTAELAVRLAVDGLTGREQDSPLLSWKGPDDLFKAEGFRVSNRYLLTHDQLFETRYAYKASECPVCGRSSR